MADQRRPGGYVIVTYNRGGGGGVYRSNLNEIISSNGSIPGCSRYNEQNMEPFCYHCGTKHLIITAKFCSKCEVPRIYAGFSEEDFGRYHFRAINQPGNQNKSDFQPKLQITDRAINQPRNREMSEICKSKL